MRSTHWLLFGIAILMLAGTGCATSDSPSGQAVGADTATRDCLSAARRFTQTFDGRPQMTIDQDRYQRCLSERRQTEQPAR